MDDILQQKDVITYDEVFGDLKVGHVVLVEGRPGCGKTTFVHKITRDWANKVTQGWDTESCGAIRIALLVSLRVLNDLRKPSLDLSDILSLFKDLKVSKAILEECNGKGVCFIFDGLDEFSPPDGKDSLVYAIITKRYLHQSTVIVASRPAATAELRSGANKVIEVLGFRNNQIMEYCDYYPFQDRSKSMALKAYLSCHPNILHMCYLPIHAAMVAFLFGVAGDIPRTETEVYKHFTHLTIMRSITRSTTSTSDSIDVRNLSRDDQELFNRICQLALDKTIANKQVLHQDEVKSQLMRKKGKDISLGLITIDPAAGLYGYKDIYTFLHLTFQEFLAAYHISTLSEEDQHKLFNEVRYKSHMQVVWKFYCGMVNFGVANGNFKTILHMTSGQTLFQVQCAYESQQLLVCSRLLKAIHYEVRLVEKFLTTSDCTAIGYVLNSSVVPTALSIVRCNLSLEAVDAMLLQMGKKSRKFGFSVQNFRKAFCCSYAAKRLEFQAEDDPDVECIEKLLTKFSFLKRLSVNAGHKAVLDESESFFMVRNYSASVIETKDLSYAFGIVSESCTELRVENAIINSESLVRSLHTRRYLSSLGLVTSILCSWQVQALANGLRLCTNLKELDVSDNGLRAKGAKTLATGLQFCRKLERINIRWNGMSMNGALHIFSSLEQCDLKVYREDVAEGNDITSTQFLFILQKCQKCYK